MRDSEPAVPVSPDTGREELAAGRTEDYWSDMCDVAEPAVEEFHDQHTRADDGNCYGCLLAAEAAVKAVRAALSRSPERATADNDSNDRSRR